MRAIVITRPGGPEVLEVRERPDPVPSREQLLVRVSAFGVNRADLLQRRGLYPAPLGAPADVPGLELTGTVIAGGGDTTRFGAGDRIMSLMGGGAYAELAAVREAEAVAVPASLSDDEAAATMEAFVTAFDALKRLAVERGDWVLIHAVGSGVGTAAVQLAHAWGLRTIGTSRTSAKLERASGLGLESGVDTSREDYVDVARRVTGGAGVQGVLDLIGGEALARSLDALRPKGRLVLVGLTAGRRAQLDLGVVLSRRLTIEGTVLRSRAPEEKARLVAAFEQEALPLIVSGAVRPVVDHVYRWDQARESHAALESNSTFGKVVVRVD